MIQAYHNIASSALLSIVSDRYLWKYIAASIANKSYMNIKIEHEMAVNRNDNVIQYYT